MVAPNTIVAVLCHALALACGISHFFDLVFRFAIFFIVQWAIKEVLINFFKVWNMLH